ncbi:MAG: hypothetical protein AAGJ85_01115 [Pseudomonadota bacterium]
MSVAAPAIAPGNGEANVITLDGLSRVGSTLYVPEVKSETPAFLVVHPFLDGAPLREDYTAATYIDAGVTENVPLLLDQPAESGSRMIIMFHEDVNRDGLFQFGDGITVPDAPVIEGTTMIALPALVPRERAITPEDIRGSYRLHAQKAQTYLERAAFREDGIEARSRALVHQYMADVERPDRSIELFDDILADTFALDFSSGTLTDRDAFDAWLQGPASSVAASAHEILNLTVIPLNNQRYQIDFTVNWNGLTADGSRLQATTQHRWVVIDDDAELPKIQGINVEIIDPFRPTEWG